MNKKTAYIFAVTSFALFTLLSTLCLLVWGDSYNGLVNEFFGRYHILIFFILLGGISLIWDGNWGALIGFSIGGGLLIAKYIQLAVKGDTLHFILAVTFFLLIGILFYLPIHDMTKRS